MSTSSVSSGLKNADALIFNGRNRVNAVTVLTDGTNAATLILYDGTTASGTELVKISATGASLGNTQEFNIPIKAEAGIYADITGTGATYIVYYGG